MCCICRDVLENDQKALECGHMFHEEVFDLQLIFIVFRCLFSLAFIDVKDNQNSHFV